MVYDLQHFFTAYEKEDKRKSPENKREMEDDPIQEPSSWQRTTRAIVVSP